MVNEPSVFEPLKFKTVFKSGQEWTLPAQQGQLKILPDQAKRQHQSYLRCSNGIARIKDKLASRLEDPQVILCIILTANFLISY